MYFIVSLISPGGARRLLLLVHCWQNIALFYYRRCFLYNHDTKIVILKDSFIRCQFSTFGAGTVESFFVFPVKNSSLFQGPYFCSHLPCLCDKFVISSIKCREMKILLNTFDVSCIYFTTQDS